MQLAGSGCLDWEVAWNAHSELYFSEKWVESGTERTVSGGIPPSLPHFGYFFYDSLEIVMKGRPGGKKQLFVQRPGFFFLDGAF